MQTLNPWFGNARMCQMHSLGQTKRTSAALEGKENSLDPCRHEKFEMIRSKRETPTKKPLPLCSSALPDERPRLGVHPTHDLGFSARSAAAGRQPPRLRRRRCGGRASDSVGKKSCVRRWGFRKPEGWESRATGPRDGKTLKKIKKIIKVLLHILYIPFICYQAMQNNFHAEMNPKNLSYKTNTLNI